MLNSCLRTVSTILEYRSSPSLIFQHPELITSLYQILSSPNTPLEIIDQLCKFVLQLGSTKASTHELSRLSFPLIARISLLTQQNYLNLVATPLESSLFALSHIISGEQTSCMLYPSTTNRKISIKQFMIDDDYFNVVKPESSSSSSATSTTATLYYDETSTNPIINGTFKVDVSQFLNSLLNLIRNPYGGVSVAAIAALTKIQYYAPDIATKKRLSQPLLPALIPFLDNPNPDIRVFRTLAILCRDDEQISRLALEANVVTKLVSIIKTADTENWSNSGLVAECLLGLAAISLHDGSFRNEVVDTNVLPTIVTFMTAKTESPISQGALGLRKIKIASCHVIRALARSMSLLRTGLTNVGIVDGILELLKTDPNDTLKAYEKVYVLDEFDKKQVIEDEMEIKSAVTAAVCNLIPEFSCLNTTMVEKGVLDELVKGAKSDYLLLRLNSVWALKHAVNGLDKTRKQQVVDALGPEFLMEMCEHRTPDIREQGLSFLRNLTCSGHPDIVDDLLEKIGFDRFFNLLASILRKHTNYQDLEEDDDDDEDEEMTDTNQSVVDNNNRRRHRRSTNNNNNNYKKPNTITRHQLDSATRSQINQDSLILISAVYIIVHLATVSTDYRQQIMQHSELLPELVTLLRHKVRDVRVACCWAFINLTWVETSEGVEKKQVIHDITVQLIEKGVDKAIQKRTKDPHMDVVQRAKVALFQITNNVEDHDNIGRRNNTTEEVKE